MIKTHFICIFFICYFTKSCISDLFTSYSDMVKLSQEQAEITRILKNFIQNEEAKIRDAKKLFSFKYLFSIKFYLFSDKKACLKSLKI